VNQMIMSTDNADPLLESLIINIVIVKIESPNTYEIMIIIQE
jgi:hypothetical protein